MGWEQDDKERAAPTASVKTQAAAPRTYHASSRSCSVAAARPAVCRRRAAGVGEGVRLRVLGDSSQTRRCGAVGRYAIGMRCDALRTRTVGRCRVRELVDQGEAAGGGQRGGVTAGVGESRTRVPVGHWIAVMIWAWASESGRVLGGMIPYTIRSAPAAPARDLAAVLIAELRMSAVRS